MTLLKYNHMPNIFDDVNHWFDRLTNNNEFNLSEYKIFHPNFDVKKNEKEYLVIADLPGMEKKDVKIDIVDNVLTISGERNGSNKHDNSNYRISEICYGSFSRSFTLPKDILESNIKAKMINGVLELRLPIEKPIKAETKHIEIK